MIRDLDSDAPKTEELPVEAIPDEQLFMDGRIRDLFNRVLERKKALWDPVTRTRQPVKKKVSELQNEDGIEEAWATVEEDCMAHYKAGNVEAWVVRFGTEKYACQVFKDDISHDSFVKKHFDELAKYLMKTYPGVASSQESEEPVMSVPAVIKRKPGRPRAEEHAVA